MIISMLELALPSLQFGDGWEVLKNERSANELKLFVSKAILNDDQSLGNG